MHLLERLFDTVMRIRRIRRFSQLVILVSFLVTFGFIRAVTHLQRAGILPNQQGPFHVHHLVPGIILLIISGYVGIAFWSVRTIRVVMAVLYGIGAALTIDEVALWLYLRDVYWEKQGRDSVDAVIVVVVLLLIVFMVSEAYGHVWLTKPFKKAGT